MGEERVDRQIDARSVTCPRPILQAKKALVDMSLGQVLLVLVTDPAAANDFHLFAKQTGNELLEAVETNGEFRILIKRA